MKEFLLASSYQKFASKFVQVSNPDPIAVACSGVLPCTTLKCIKEKGGLPKVLEFHMSSKVLGHTNTSPMFLFRVLDFVKLRQDQECRMSSHKSIRAVPGLGV